MRPIEWVLAVLLALGLYTQVAAQETLELEAAGAHPGDGSGVVNPPFTHAALEQLAQRQRVCVVAVATIRSRMVTGSDVASGCGAVQAPAVQPIFQAASLSKPVFAFWPGTRWRKSLGLDWGLGWGMETAPNGESFIWHWGNNPGYRAFVMASVQSGGGVVMLTSGENGLALAEPIVQAVLPGSHKTFQFSRIPNGLEHWVCRTLGLCF